MADIFAAVLQALRISKEPKFAPTNLNPVYTQTKAGVFIDPDQALTNAAAWACVRYLSQTVAQVPWEVFQKKKEGAERVEGPVADVLGLRPNSEMGPFNFKETLMHWAVRWGNGYAEIERDMAQRVIALWPIHPTRVKVIRDTAGSLLYEISNDTAPISYLKPVEMFHVRGFGDGPVGYGVVEFAAQTIGWAKAAQLFGAGFFGEGMSPPLVLEIPGTMKLETKTRLERALHARMGGPYRAGKTFIADAGMKLKEITIQPDKAQFIETMQFQVEDVCRWFGVPPHKVMHLLRSTFNNIEHQSIEVVVDSIVPWTKRFEEEADWKLFGQNRQRMFTKFNLRELQRGDNASRGAYYKDMFYAGSLSPNEIRQLEGKNPRKGGDEYFTPVNMVSSTALKLANTQTTVPTVVPAAEPSNPSEPEEDAEDMPAISEELRKSIFALSEKIYG